MFFVIVEQFLRFDFHDQKVAVVAIKGTSPLELLDIVADVRLWSESVLVSIASSFLPTLSLMSSGMIATVINGFKQSQKFFEGNKMSMLQSSFFFLFFGYPVLIFFLPASFSYSKLKM